MTVDRFWLTFVRTRAALYVEKAAACFGFYPMRRRITVLSHKKEGLPNSAALREETAPPEMTVQQ